MSKVLAGLAFVLLIAKGAAAEIPDAVVGNTYWVNDRPADAAAVPFYTDAHGKSISLDNSHSFVLVELDSRNPRDPGYKVRIDDGRELYLHGDDLKRTLFIDKDYVFEGRGYLSIRQYIFAGSPAEITGTIDRKQTAIRREAAAAKQAKAAAFAARLSKAEADFQSRSAARIARRGVRLGMTREQVRDSSWEDPDHVNLTTTAEGQREQWVYPNQNFLYFTNGVLTGIQNHSDDDGYFGRVK